MRYQPCLLPQTALQLLEEVGTRATFQLWNALMGRRLAPARLVLSNTFSADDRSRWQRSASSCLISIFTGADLEHRGINCLQPTLVAFRKVGSVHPPLRSKRSWPQGAHWQVSTLWRRHYLHVFEIAACKGTQAAGSQSFNKPVGQI